jgi:hypothetical protein
MANNLVQFDVIKSGIQKLRDRAENGIKRITADFLVNNFFEDIETMRKRGFNYEEILDELNIMLTEHIPQKEERDKIFAITAGTLKVYMSRKRKSIAEGTTKATKEKQTRKKSKNVLDTMDTTQKIAVNIFKSETAMSAINAANVPTGKARATDLDREI